MKLYRTETDSMGEMQVPADALYGAQTARALENFPISGLRFPRGLLDDMRLPGRGGTPNLTTDDY
jgi:fumarate hydratase class II